MSDAYYITSTFKIEPGDYPTSTSPSEPGGFNIYGANNRISIVTTS
jgi:hypothetical protein